MTNPTCCGKESRFVNNGRTLQYFFCDECKKEVEHPDPLMYVQTLSDEDADEFFKRLSQTQLEDYPTVYDFDDLGVKLKQVSSPTIPDGFVIPQGQLVEVPDFTVKTYGISIPIPKDSEVYPYIVEIQKAANEEMNKQTERLFFSTLSNPEEFPDTEVIDGKRGKIFELPPGEVTVEDLIEGLKRLPGSAKLVATHYEFNSDSMMFKIMHESFPLIPEGAEYERDTLCCYEDEDCDAPEETW